MKWQFAIHTSPQASIHQPFFPIFAQVKKLPRFLLCFLSIALLLLPFYGLSQVDSVKKFEYFYDFRMLPGQQEIRWENPSDSILRMPNLYDKLLQSHVQVPRTGNAGSASLLLFPYFDKGKIYTDGFNQFDAYLMNPLARTIGAPERRFSNLSYHLGTIKEQHIFVKHEQRIKPWFIFGLDFGAAGSQGDFSRQLNANRNFDLYFTYEAPSSVYRAFASFTSNFVNNQENGGITSDSAFEAATSLDARTLPIYLDNASNKMKTKDYFLKQELNISRLFSKADSSSRHFTDGSFVLSHAIWWDRKSNVFSSQNPDSGYFSNFYYDSVTTFDSSFYNDLYNVAMIEYSSQPTDNGVSFKLGAGVENQDVKYFTYNTDTGFNTSAVLITAGLRINKLTGDFSVHTNVAGDTPGTYKGIMLLNYILNKRNDKATLSFSISKSPQEMKNIFYNSNHFIWKNNFALLEKYDVAAGFYVSKYKLTFNLRSTISRNFIFYREDYLPQAYDKFVAINNVTIGKSFDFNKVGWDNKVELNSSGNENVASAPAYAFYSFLYYRNIFFKKALKFKAGLDVSYFEKYYGYGYMPATGVFYLQEEKQIGGFPKVGAVVMFTIKSASLLVKLENATAGFNTREYYGALHYPLPGRTFKFGVSWDLKD